MQCSVILGPPIYPHIEYQQQYYSAPLYVIQQHQAWMPACVWPENNLYIEEVWRQAFPYKERPIVAHVLEGARAFSLVSDAMQTSLDSISCISSETQQATLELLTQYDTARKQTANHIHIAKCKCEKAFEALTECHILSSEDASITLALQEVKLAQENCQSVFKSMSLLQNCIEKTTRKAKRILQRKKSGKSGRNTESKQVKQLDTRQIAEHYRAVLPKIEIAISQIATAAQAIDAAILSIKGY